MKRLTLFLSLLIFTSFAFFSCNEDDDASPEMAEVNFSWNYHVNGDDFQYGSIYDINGTAVQFDFAWFYVHGITFIKDDMSEYTVEDKHLLVKPEAATYDIDALSDGHYHRVKFFVGVDSVNNHQSEDDFTNRPADDPLALQSPERMHWSWNTGYIFFKINGMVDTDDDGTPETLMEFHVGADDFLREVDVVAHQDLEPGENTVPIRLNMAKLFEGIDLSQDHSTHTFDNLDLAETFVDNYQGAFEIAHN